jgi:hypothetical protein
MGMGRRVQLQRGLGLKRIEVARAFSIKVGKKVI